MEENEARRRKMRGLVNVVGHGSGQRKGQRHVSFGMWRGPGPISHIPITPSRWDQAFPLDLTFSGEIHGRGLIPDVV